MTAPLIYTQLAEVMDEIGAVGKNRKNLQGGGYQYRGIDDVMAAAQPLFAKHGVVVVADVVEREREAITTNKGNGMVSVRLLVRHTFFASDGSSVVCTTLGEAFDSGDKASNKAMAVALKYALTTTLCLPTYEADRDTDEHTHEVAPPRVQERPTPQERPRAPVVDTDAFMAVTNELAKVWTGDEGRQDRLSWWWDRFKTSRDAVMPVDWSPSKAYRACDDKRKAKILETAKALVESEVHPDDRK